MQSVSKFIITISLLIILFLPYSFAQDTTKSNLLESAKIRLGKGTLGEIDYFPDATRFAVATSIGVWIYDSITGKGLYPLIDPTNHLHGFNSVRFSSDGKTIATEGPDATVLLWNAATGQLLRSLTGDKIGLYRPVFSPDGNIIATSSGNSFEMYDKTLQLWDVRIGQLIKTLAEPNDVYYNKRFSPDGKTIAIWQSRYNPLQLWDVNTGQHLKNLTTHEVRTDNVYFSPDGKTIATSGSDKTLRLWDARTGEFLKKLSDYFREERCMDVSPDGNIFAMSNSGVVDLLDLSTRQHLNTLSLIRHVSLPYCGGGTITTVRFSANGETITTGSFDGTVRVWSANSGKHLKTFIGHTSRISSVAFSPDGKILASGSFDGTILLWDVP